MHQLLSILLLAPTGVGSGAKSFKQLEELLPTPSEVRLASGAPGPEYWQQTADYEIEAQLFDSEAPYIEGKARITYNNKSPHTLPYLWVQMDQNSFARGAARSLISSAPDFAKFGHRHLSYLLAIEDFDGGYKLKSVQYKKGRPLKHTVVGTMMRLDLKEALRPGKSVSFEIEWSHQIVNAKEVWARGGYEHFREDGNKVYTIAQWFPRMAVYNDVTGWQNKPFLGRGEFALELGDYEVEITVPADHVVAATGALQNPGKVMSSLQRKRMKRARTSKSPTFIVNEAEATDAEKSKAKGTKTWVFEAENVRDFAFATSRKFIWDAWGVDTGEGKTMAMSFYPKEAEPLWSTYSTQSVAHTIEVYGRMTFPYPYPTCISVNGPIGGMEYPMISFNGPRPEKDKTYFKRAAKGKPWRHTKYGLISVIIHEVGHNWFPMIVNSDERQWTWMDEGLNTFLQFIAEQEWEPNYPSWRGFPSNIVSYMRSTRSVPIMTNSESLLQFGNNAYAKPATALNILRETILGRENFDYAFKVYANRWRFKHPEPADLFRTMEDASGVDLDWFWRGWFYTTDHVDIGIERVRAFELSDGDPEKDKPAKKKKRDEDYAKAITVTRNKDLDMRINRFPELKDFYNSYEEFDVVKKDKDDYEKMLKDLEPEEREVLKTKRHFYAVDLRNHGGVVMPIILRITYADDATELLRMPAEMWRMDAQQVTKLLMTKKPLKRLELDPFRETADAEEENDHWPRKAIKSRFQLFKQKKKTNPMKAKKKAAEKAKKDAEKKAKEAKEKKGEKGTEKKGEKGTEKKAAPAK